MTVERGAHKDETKFVGFVELVELVGFVEFIEVATPRQVGARKDNSSSPQALFDFGAGVCLSFGFCLSFELCHSDFTCPLASRGRTSRSWDGASKLFSYY
jgi:hypothetical protein